jgi:multicomponent Na+:H+ antiporter subunit C
MVHFNYWAAVVIIMIGFYGVIAKRNLLKQAISLGLFQTGVFLFYVTMGVVTEPEIVDAEGNVIEGVKSGIAPIWSSVTNDAGEVVHGGAPFDNPLPHVLMLTAIVVGVSTLAVAVALIVRIREAYGTVEEDEVLAADRADEEVGA